MLRTNMAAEVVDRPSEDSASDANMSVVANTSEISYETQSDTREQIYKFGFSLSDLYKLSLVFYKKGEDLVADVQFPASH